MAGFFRKFGIAVNRHLGCLFNQPQLRTSSRVVLCDRCKPRNEWRVAPVAPKGDPTGAVAISMRNTCDASHPSPGGVGGSGGNVSCPAGEDTQRDDFQHYGFTARTLAPRRYDTWLFYDAQFEEISCDEA